MSHYARLPLIAVLCLGAAAPAWAQGPPKQVGQCVNTQIKSVETRLMGVPGSGSAVAFQNDSYQVGYDTVPEVEQSRRGDPVRMCLVSIPKNCPKGDDRGRVYRTTNLRTNQSWSLPDSQHMCGGA